ncbi:MAG TPA: SOS response-associated peptidase [Tepidisphaeraceae bacterium]|jgi:putative SOS response-associated peptidase YedK
MCGRYTLVRLADVLEKFPWIEHGPPDLVPRYNIAPTQPLLAIANDHPEQFDHLVWGLVPFWAKDPAIGNKMINARAESLAEKPAFRNLLKRRRCLVIADGFYEWMPDPAGGKKGGKIPMYVQMKDRKPFAFAGLWDTWKGSGGAPAASEDGRTTVDTGQTLRTCTIITTAANDLMKPIHDRMPAIIPPEDYRCWLDAKDEDAVELEKMLCPYPADEMTAHPVSTIVNSPKNEVPACIEAVAKETLF